jgi:hypothetical protein
LRQVVEHEERGEVPVLDHTRHSIFSYPFFIPLSCRNAGQVLFPHTSFSGGEFGRFLDACAENAERFSDESSGAFLEFRLALTHVLPTGCYAEDICYFQRRPNHGNSGGSGRPVSNPKGLWVALIVVLETDA